MRYRAQNFNGWGSFSEISYKLAANAPPKPYAPVYVSSNDEEITFLLTTPENDSGAEITEYALYFDHLRVGETEQILLWAGLETEITVGVDDGLVTG